MKQYGVLAAAFGGTLAVLLIAFLVIEQLGAASTPEPSPIAEATPVIRSLPPRVTASPGVAPSPSRSFMPRPSEPPDDPTPSPEPADSAAPGRTPRPTPSPVAPGTVVEIVVPGTRMAQQEVPANGSVTNIAGGGVLLRTTRDLSEQLEVAYKLPMSQIPPGMKVARMDTRICGDAEGDFWETYGPARAEPYEYEVEKPEADGCWHYANGALTDNAVFAIIRGETTFRVDKVVYTLTAR
jgi:hypothetical protein